jgi:hypothetical protein
MNLEIMNHSPYGSDLVSIDIHMFRPKKVYVVGHKFHIDDELKCSFLNSLCSRDKTFYAGDISNLPGWWEKCVSVKREYSENALEFGDSGTCISL